MTTTAEQTKADKDAALKARNEDMERREKELNASRSGKGLRICLGMSRGRNPVEVQYENWDEKQPDTLPVSLSEFMDLRKISDEAAIIKRLIAGDNDVLYDEASDPVSAFVETSWSDEVQKAFKTVVKQYSVNASVSIEDAVALIKPGIVASQAKRS